MADGSTRPLKHVRAGDVLYGTVRKGRYRRYVKTRVLAHWQVTKPAYRVRLRDGTCLIAGADHRFWTERGWKFVAENARGKGQRPYLTTNNRLLGTGGFSAGPRYDEDYKQGYLCGVCRGDGLLGFYQYDGRRRAHERQWHFRLALVDGEALRRAAEYLREFGVPTHDCLFQRAVGNRKELRAIRTNARGHVERVQELLTWPRAQSLSWCKGFLAGIFDAEGSYSDGTLRMSNTDAKILDQLTACLDRLRFAFALEQKEPERARPLFAVRVCGGLREHLRFFHSVGPAITRKRDIEGQALKSSADLRVTSVQPLGVCLPLFDITTETGDFIADGVLSHNCYARPSHEYLGLSAGLDFETKILVKERAPDLLREFLARPSWQPESLTLSGVTDPYQPAERHFRLTRGCLEVVAEARQPVSLITKSALVLRDLDLLRDLAAENLVHVNVSVTTLDADLARSLEPRTSTPAARLRAIQGLSAAGIPVRVLVAPIIPGLNDSEIPAILAAAREAGARAAGCQLVRLPGAVAPVFLEWLQREQPDIRGRVEGRIRAVREGKLNDPNFGTRMTGTGEVARQIRELFRLFARRHGLDGGLPAYDCSRFRPPRTASGQGWLF
jgi:DNA repair photolyase